MTSPPRTSTVFVLPSIPATDAEKNALAIRNVCATEGRCPSCRAASEVNADLGYAGIWHYVFEHERDCPGMNTGEAA